MKLYKKQLIPGSRSVLGGSYEEVPPTLSDIRAAAKEMGYAVVTFEPDGEKSKKIWLAGLSAIQIETEGWTPGKLQYVKNMIRAMIKAAEDEQ